MLRAKCVKRRGKPSINKRVYCLWLIVGNSSKRWMFVAIFAQFLASVYLFCQYTNACHWADVFRNPLKHFSSPLLSSIPPYFLPSNLNSLFQKNKKKGFTSEVWCLSYPWPDQSLSRVGNGFSVLLVACCVCLHSTITSNSLVLSQLFFLYLSITSVCWPQRDNDLHNPQWLP